MHLRVETASVVGDVLHWRRRLRTVHPERCPRSGPIVFAGNHGYLEDPFITYHATSTISNNAVKLRPMMREGVFAGNKIMNSRLFDVDEFATLFGVMNISRDNVKLSQLKPFVKELRERGTILIYPTRTRTRTGTIIEFPEGFDEPGGVSFFVTQAQKLEPGLRVTVSPVTRTDNPVNDTVTLAFGEQMFLDSDTPREAQREFDYRLLQVISEHVVVNVPLVMATLFYLRCLHGLPVEVDARAIGADVSRVFEALPKRILEVPDDIEGEVRRTLKWFAKHEVLSLSGGGAMLDRERILSAPAPDREYKRKNMVKYLANHFLHLSDVVAAIEAVVLDEAEARV
jgi:1-acyl-sn-glycerol-3-phosphate acyltransferase